MRRRAGEPARRNFEVGASLAALVAVGAAGSTIVVTPTNTQGWTTSDTRPGGSVGFVADATAPAGVGALRLTTDSTTAAKAQYMHATDTPLASVSELGYETKQNSASFAQGDPSYQLVACLGGWDGSTCTGFTTFVFEPYWNTSQGVVTNGVWQTWDVASAGGLMWSSRSYDDGAGCAVTAGAGGPPLYSLGQIQAMCPNADVVGFGVSIGTYNPSYDVETDLVDFNGTTYDFEPYAVALTKDQCKDGGWQSARRADESPFKNQGDCIQYVNTGK